MQRWFGFSSAYTYTLEYRPGKSKGNADLLSRLPLPATEADNHPNVRLSDPTDFDVDLIGASGVQIEQLAAKHESNQHRSGNLDPGFIFAVGEKELRIAPFTTSEQSAQTWNVIQKERAKRLSKIVEPKRRFAIPDETPLVRPTSVISGQWKPGLVLHACPITEEERFVLGLIEKQTISVINPEDGRGSAGVAGNPGPTDNNEELPEEEFDSIEAREFGEKLCEKTASEWAEAQMKDESARITIEFLHSGVPVG